MVGRPTVTGVYGLPLASSSFTWGRKGLTTAPTPPTASIARLAARARRFNPVSLRRDAIRLVFLLQRQDFDLVVPPHSLQARQRSCR